MKVAILDAREHDARNDHSNFFFDHEACVGEMGAKHGFNYTALRPQLVTEPTPGALNVLPAIGAYAAIRHEKGGPFGFPGGPSFVWEAADADLVAVDTEVSFRNARQSLIDRKLLPRASK
jgi:hypothetical protein